MPWSDNSGNGGSGGPWGGGPSGPGSGSGPGRGREQPGLDDLFRSSQDKLKNVLPKGGGSPNFTFLLVLLGLVALFLYNSFYTIEAEELGVELRFGQPKEELSQPGLHFMFWPMERLEVVKIIENQINIGPRKGGGGTSESGLMLSGDQNIVDVTFTVQWRIDRPKDYLFNVRDPQGLVRQVAESAMREVVSRRPAGDIYRDERDNIAREVRDIAQQILNAHGTGVAITALNIEDSAPPPEVADAFDEVQRAEQDEVRLKEEANRYRAEKLGVARGKAAEIREKAAGYKARVVQEAEGEAQRFISVHEEYAKAPEVTRQRLFYETLERVLKSSDKVILEGGQGGSGVVPYLPLPELNKNRVGGNQ